LGWVFSCVIVLFGGSCVVGGGVVGCWGCYYVYL